MMAEAGLGLLWLAAALSLLQVAVGALSLMGKGEALAPLMKPVAILQGLLVALSFLSLIAVFLSSDMSVKLVAANSHSDKPWLYKLSGTWGNHEGSMLLWVTVLALAGAGIAAFERRIKAETLIASLMAQALISLGFYAFLLFSSNPFERLSPAPENGMGLNPMLQDPGLAFHPPTLYFGYVGMSVAFSFAVGALLTRDVGAEFARAMRPWVLGAWIFLTIGITAGSYWAYYELGWGGWWFWDPVENASLMPWLASTALLHSVTVLATRDSLRAWTIMLAVVAFSMSMVGTFLVRSGILTSVHAFAVDPERGSFLLALLALYIGGALTLFALRIGTVREGTRFDLVSREGFLVANNLLLSVVLGTVLIGTLYPIVAQAFGQQVSIGAPYFNSTAGSLGLLIAFLMVFGPVTRWRRDDVRPVLKRLMLPALLLAGVTVAVLLLAPDINILPKIGMMVSAFVILGSLAPLWKRNLRRTPLFTIGMVVAHLGIGVALAGMAAEAAFTREVLAAAKPGQRFEIGPFSVTFNGVKPVAGPNWTALEADMRVERSGSGKTFTVAPQARMFSEPPTETSEAALSTHWDGQLYLVLGKQDAQDRWQVRMWWKPLVTLIWAGGLLIALGGVLALVGHLRREARSRWRREYWMG